MKRHKLSLKKAHLEYGGGTSIPPTSARLPTRSLCCQFGCKLGILYQGSLLRRRSGTGNLNFPRQHHGAPGDLSHPFAGGGKNLAGPGRPGAGEATGTYSTHPSSTTSENGNPGFDVVSLRGVPP